MAWAGRFWARTDCSFSQLGHGSCTTGDCGCGILQCDGSYVAPPVTHAVFTLKSGAKNIVSYNVSLLEGFKIPISIIPTRGCSVVRCVSDLNCQCPIELQVKKNKRVRVLLSMNLNIVAPKLTARAGRTNIRIFSRLLVLMVIIIQLTTQTLLRAEMQITWLSFARSLFRSMKNVLYSLDKKSIWIMSICSSAFGIYGKETFD